MYAIYTPTYLSRYLPFYSVIVELEPDLKEIELLMFSECENYS